MILLENRFTVHAHLADSAIQILRENFASAVSFLPQFNVGYLISGNPKTIPEIQKDLISKFTTGNYDLILQEARLAPNVVDEISGNIVTYNSMAFDHIDDTDIPRLVGGSAHECCHRFGYFHNTWWRPNLFSADKGMHSIPYLVGGICYALALGKSDSEVKDAVTKLYCFSGGRM